MSKMRVSPNPLWVCQIYTVSLHNLKIKKGISPTPLNCVLKALIFALNDSAVSRLFYFIAA